MPIDREATLRQADKLYRQGRIDLAIAEYVRLVEDQPRDWNSINALGDLYLKAGDTARAVAQYAQIADHLFNEGFYPKAAALYKKTLKASPQHEHTLLRLSEIAAAQELLADARSYLRQLWEIRRERGDEAGAADCLLRLARLPEADVETILTGARASKALGNSSQAADLFRLAAERLEGAGRGRAALDALSQVAALDPKDASLRRRLATEYAALGEFDQAEQFVQAEGAADPELLLILATIHFARRRDNEARTTLTRLIAIAPDRAEDVLRLAGERGRAGDADQAFACADVVVDDAVLRGEWDRAIDVLRSFLVHGAHAPALQKLVQVAADADRGDVASEARERLADAWPGTGSPAEAQTIVEGTHDPRSDTHDRLRRPRQVSGEEDVEDVAAAVHSTQPQPDEDAFATKPMAVVVEPEEVAPSFEAFELQAEDALSGSVFEPEELPVYVPPQAAAPSAAVEEEDEEAIAPVEIDLSDALSALGPRAAVPIAPAPPSAGEPAAQETDLEAVFDALRPRTVDYRNVTDAAALYELGLQRLEAGQVEDALADLERASRAPAFRFPAAARLGREYIGRGRVETGIHWLERASEMPPPSPEDGLAVLYDLAVALEENEEYTRAVAVLMEIESEAGEYRDVRQRIDGLTRQRKGRRA